MITENVFEGRFMFVDELVRLGADVRTDGHHAVVRGRAAALRRPGRRATTSGPAPRSCSPAWSPTGHRGVADVHHIDRGYPRFAEPLRASARDGRPASD